MSNILSNVFLADDDEDDRMFFSEAIAEISNEVKLSLFKDGRELLDYLNQPEISLPEIIFLDINMPVIDGMQCLTKIRENSKFKDLLIAIYSTSSSEKDLEEAYKKGANVYINKPSCYTQLKETVEKVLKLNWKKYMNDLNKKTFHFRV